MAATVWDLEVDAFRLLTGSCADIVRESAVDVSFGRENNNNAKSKQNKQTNKQTKQTKIRPLGFEHVSVSLLAFKPDALPSKPSPSLGICYQKMDSFDSWLQQMVPWGRFGNVPSQRFENTSVSHGTSPDLSFSLPLLFFNIIIYLKFDEQRLFSCLFL